MNRKASSFRGSFCSHININEIFVNEKWPYFFYLPCKGELFTRQKNHRKVKSSGRKPTLVVAVAWSIFQESIVSDPGLLWVCFTSPFDWSRKLVPPSQPIKCKSKTNPNFATGVFPRIKQVAEFSLVNDDAALFLLVVVITLVLVLWLSIENGSKWSCFDQ